jgi:hypothetical protein
MNRLTLQTTLLLLLIPLSFAFTDMPSCITQYSLLGSNFTITDTGQNFTCGVSTAFYTGGWFGAVTPINVFLTYQYNSSHTVFYSSTLSIAQLFNISVPSSGNYTHEFNTGGASVSLNISNHNHPTERILLTGASMVYFNETNSTHYNISYSGSATSILIQKNDSIDIQFYAAAASSYLFYFQNYNTTKELNFYGDYARYFNSTIRDVFGTQAYISLNGVNGKIVRSDFCGGSCGSAMVNSTAADSYCKAMIYYGGATIYPKITYTPGLSAFGYWYNASSGIAYIPNNTAVYVLDSTTNTWYFVPSLSCDNFVDTYTISALYYSAGVSYSAISMPLIPTTLSCSQSGNNYTISSLYPMTVTHVVYYNNGTDFNATSSVSSAFSFTINTNQYPNVNYTVNGVTTCWRSSNATLLGTAINWPSGGFEKYVAYLPFLTALAASTWNPFGLLFVAYISDAYQLMSAETTATLIVIVAFISLLINYRGAMTLKAVVTYMLITIGIISYYTSFVGAVACDKTPLTALTTAFNSLSLVSIESFVASAPIFLVNVGNAILNTPGNAIAYALCMTNLAAPIMSTPLAIFVPLLMLAANIVLLLLLYQIIANRFNLV